MTISELKLINKREGYLSNFFNSNQSTHSVDLFRRFPKLDKIGNELEERENLTNRHGSVQWISIDAEIVYEMEKLFALARYMNITLKPYFKKGVLPSPEMCERFLFEKGVRLNRYGIKLVSIIDRIRFLSKSLDLIGFNSMSDESNNERKEYLQNIFSKVEKEITSEKTYSISQFIKQFIAHNFFNLFGGLKWISPFFSDDINILTKKKLETVSIDEILSKRGYVEERREILKEDQFLYGCMLNFLKLSGSFLSNDRLYESLLFSFLQTAPVMETIIDSQFFKDFKSKLFQKGVSLSKNALVSQLKKMEVESVRDAFFPREVFKDLFENPKQAEKEIFEGIKSFFQESLNDIKYQSEEVRREALLSFEKTLSSFSRQSDFVQKNIDSVYDLSKNVRLANRELCKRLKYNFKKNLQSEYKALFDLSPFLLAQSEFGIYSPEIDFYEHCFSLFHPNAFQALLPLLMGNSKSTDMEFLMRMALGGLFFLKENPTSKMGVILSCFLVKLMASGLPKRREFIKQVDMVLDKMGKEMKRNLMALESAVFDRLPCRVSLNHAALQVLKEGMLSLPSVILSLYSDNPYYFYWYFLYTPINNFFSSLLIKSNLVKENSIELDSTIYEMNSKNSIIYDSLFYLNSFLFSMYSTKIANLIAVFSQMPTIKKNGSKALNFLFSPIIDEHGSRFLNNLINLNNFNISLSSLFKSVEFLNYARKYLYLDNIHLKILSEYSMPRIKTSILSNVEAASLKAAKKLLPLKGLRAGGENIKKVRRVVSNRFSPRTIQTVKGTMEKIKRESASLFYQLFLTGGLYSLSLKTDLDISPLKELPAIAAGSYLVRKKKSAVKFCLITYLTLYSIMEAAKFDNNQLTLLNQSNMEYYDVNSTCPQVESGPALFVQFMTTIFLTFMLSRFFSK